LKAEYAPWPGGSDRKGALFHNNLVGCGGFENLPGGFFPVLKIGRHAGPDAEGFGRRVDADEYNVRFPDSLFNIRAEEQIPAAGGQDDLIQARLVNRQTIRIPLINPIGIDIHNGHPILGTFMGNHRHGRSAHIAGTDAQDVSGKKRFHDEQSSAYSVTERSSADGYGLFEQGELTQL